MAPKLPLSASHFTTARRVALASQSNTKPNGHAQSRTWSSAVKRRQEASSSVVLRHRRRTVCPHRLFLWLGSFCAGVLDTGKTKTPAAHGDQKLTSHSRLLSTPFRPGGTEPLSPFGLDWARLGHAEHQIPFLVPPAPSWVDSSGLAGPSLEICSCLLLTDPILANLIFHSSFIELEPIFANGVSLNVECFSGIAHGWAYATADNLVVPS